MDSTTGNLTPEPVSDPLGGMISQVAGHLPQLLPQILRFAFPPPPDPLRELQQRLLQVQLTKALNGAAVPFAQLPWPAVNPEARQDFLILGPRGTGKTATAAAICQTLAKHNDLPVLAIDWPPEHAEALGFKAAKYFSKASDAVILLDEASMRTPVGKRDQILFETLALARHNNLRLVWTSQTSTAVPRDVLRLDPALIWTGPSVSASLFERSELLDIQAQAATIGLSQGWPNAISLRIGFLSGTWFATHAPLPDGWTDKTSTLWKRR